MPFRHEIFIVFLMPSAELCRSLLDPRSIWFGRPCSPGLPRTRFFRRESIRSLQKFGFPFAKDRIRKYIYADGSSGAGKNQRTDKRLKPENDLRRWRENLKISGDKQ
jgi:hypothetical protein